MTHGYLEELELNEGRLAINVDNATVQVNGESLATVNLNPFLFAGVTTKLYNDFYFHKSRKDVDQMSNIMVL